MVVVRAALTFALPLLSIGLTWASPEGRGGASLSSPRAAPSIPPAGRSCIRQAAVQEKLVAITLDDGPDPIYTPIILQVARKHNARFTFFLMGSHVESHPDLARRIAAEGHAIGNHTWSHKMMLGLTETEDKAEIECCQRAIEGACGPTPKLFRPPKGHYDATAAQAAEALGYQIVLWSIAVENHETKTPEAMTERVLSRVKPGSIILAHDGRPYDTINRDRTTKALALIVVELQKRGYKLVTVPELLAHGSRHEPAYTGRPARSSTHRRPNSRPLAASRG